MRNRSQNELNRVVSLLNFEKENMGEARSVLHEKYNIPNNYLSLIAHKIFIRLGTYDFSWPPKHYKSLWAQFHQIASEEVKLLKFQ